MLIIKVQNGEVLEYPYSIEKLKKDNPNISFPKNITEDTLNMFDVYTVYVEERLPELRFYDIKDSLVYEDGAWKLIYSYEVKDLDICKGIVKNNIITSFNRERLNGTTEGFTTSDGHTINNSEQDLSNMVNLVFEEDDTTEIMFRVLDNSFVNINIATLKQWMKELRDAGKALFAKKWTLEQQIDNATTVEELDAITW